MTAGRPRIGIGQWLTHTVFPVAAGAAIYLLWRSPGLLVFRWAAALGMASALSAARAWARSCLLPGWALFSVPDALWVYAFTAALGLVWVGSQRRVRWAWLALPGALGIGGELGQAFGLVPGTFDVVDVLLSAAAAAAAFLLTSAGRTHEHTETYCQLRDARGLRLSRSR
jgi:hypothetical protein